MSVSEIKTYLEGAKQKTIPDFFTFTDSRIAYYKTLPGKRTPEIINNVKNRVKEFRKKRVLKFSEINTDWLGSFESYYLKKGSAVNNIAFYMRYIRLMFNDAIREFNKDMQNVGIRNYPFSEYKIKTESTIHRDIPIEYVHMIRDCVPKTQREEIARNMFLLQLYMMGINSKDLFYLRPSDLFDYRIQFKRAKHIIQMMQVIKLNDTNWGSVVHQTNQSCADANV